MAVVSASRARVTFFIVEALVGVTSGLSLARESRAALDLELHRILQAVLYSRRKIIAVAGSLDRKERAHS